MARIILISIMTILLIIIFCIPILTLTISVFFHTCEILTRQEKLACVASADSTTLIPRCLLQCNWIAPNVAKTFWIDNIPGGNATDMQIQIHKYTNTNSATDVAVASRGDHEDTQQ